MLPKNLGVPIWGVPTILGGPYNEGCNVLGSILGSPFVGNYQMFNYGVFLSPLSTNSGTLS